MKPRSFQLFIVISLLSGLIGALAGCGSDSATNVSVVSAAASKECVGCHATNSKSVSTSSGVRITNEWTLSAHNTAQGAGCLDCHSYAHYHDNNVSCQSCHATAHANNGNSCSLCHGASSNVADCRTCHTSVHKDPNSCNNCHGGAIPIDIALKNPDAAGKCLNCHNNGNNFKIYSLAVKHFNNFTGAGAHPAMYVTTNYQKLCTACHEPHNPLKGLGSSERRAWALSGHGSVKGAAWSSEDMQIPAELACQRCHTATGFKRFVAGNFAPLTVSIGAATDKGREVLACDACHSNDKFTLRTVAAFTTPYVADGGSDLIPNLGESNLCIPCHTGRGSQAVILALSDAAMADTSFKNPHYMPAAGIMYMKTGFINFTSAVSQVGSTYYKNYRLPLTTDGRGGVDAVYGGVAGGVKSAHRALGGPTILLAETWITNPATFNGNKGPCVTCHLNANITGMPAVTTITAAPFLPTGTVIPAKRAANGHSLSAVSTETGKQLCMPCHNDAGDFNTAINAGDYAAAVEEKLLEAKPYFKGGLEVIARLLDSSPYNITFDNSTYPYFFVKGTTTAVRDWTRGGALTPANARKLMGACYNLKMLTADEGAYIHGRSYSQRLIFDSIDFLNDGVMNANAAATIVAVGNPLLFPNTTADHWLFKAGGGRK